MSVIADVMQESAAFVLQQALLCLSALAANSKHHGFIASTTVRLRAVLPIADTPQLLVKNTMEVRVMDPLLLKAAHVDHVRVSVCLR